MDEKHLLSFVSLNLAQCYLQTDQPSEAIQILEISRKIADNKSIQGMSSFLLYLLFKEKDLEQAGTFLEECINCWNENEEISQKLIERANTHKVLFHQKFFEQLFEQDINQAQEHLNKAINILYSLNKEEEVVKVYYEAANRLHKVDSPIAQEYYQAVYEKLSPDQDDLELREILEKSMIRLAFDALTKEQFSVAKKFFQEALKITIKNKERILSMLSHIQDIESTDQPSNQIKPPSSNKSERGKQQSHSEASSILPSIDKAVSPAEIKRKITEYYKNKGYKVTLETIVGSVQVDLMAQKKQKRILLMISTNRAEAAISILVLKGIPHQRGMKKAVYLIKGKPQEIQTDSNISIVNQLKALPS
ncbi:MAG: tetratricopeptide repeat protein [Candidatus Hodarchaeota archaeon]